MLTVATARQIVPAGDTGDLLVSNLLPPGAVRIVAPQSGFITRRFSTVGRMNPPVTSGTRHLWPLLLAAIAVPLCITSGAGKALQVAPGPELKCSRPSSSDRAPGDSQRRRADGRSEAQCRDRCRPYARASRQSDERFDLLVAAPRQIDDLIAEGLIVRESRTDIAHSGIGVAVRRGASKPDVSSLEAFSRALIAARSIAYLKEGQSGVYIAGVLDRLGVADRIKSKLTLPETDIVAQLGKRTSADAAGVVRDTCHAIRGNGARCRSPLKAGTIVLNVGTARMMVGSRGDQHEANGRRRVLVPLLQR